MNLLNAFNVALNMGRSPGLINVPVVGEIRHENGTTYTATIRGSTDEYQSELVLTPTGQQWHCSCSDFQFTFYPHIDANGEALHPFPEYIPNGRGTPRAIQDFGMCKHVMALVNRLVHDGTIPQSLEIAETIHVHNREAN